MNSQEQQNNIPRSAREQTKKLKKIIIKALPYVLMGLVCTNLGEAWRLAEGADASKKLLSFFSTLGTRWKLLAQIFTISVTTIIL